MVEYTMKVEPEVFAQALAQLRKRRTCGDSQCLACATFPSDGPTARWVAPVGEDAVRCPTCGDVVTLARWFEHGCGQVSKYNARIGSRVGAVRAGRQSNIREPVGAGLRTVWSGDKPTHCQRPGCGAAIWHGFTDGIIPGSRSTHGILCPMCGLESRFGDVYEKRGRSFVLVDRVRR